MITTVAAALLAGAIVKRWRRARARHRPRALELRLALPAPPPTLKEFVDHGWADWDGSCAWCGRLWTNCTAEILSTGRCRKTPAPYVQPPPRSPAPLRLSHRPDKVEPIAVPIAGPGVERKG